MTVRVCLELVEIACLVKLERTNLGLLYGFVSSEEGKT
jgi:hypothetical protein